ncbi:hypothetical protein JOD57_000043 [Geodermatophilus bullaregiensis]|uniref:hypothetical protein n=1 Tax=Geodermatophilus bullaregiensis TaxID=1564160 RepID=UPI00195A2848|nr:hypothetical protein [Geodermatophilus bullaregiensis]MBM7804206.1 hypothetical protein [Geodermatophilus bullaregiensis]
MTNSPITGYWALPGPRDFLKDVDRALREAGWRQPVVVAIPDYGGPPDLFSELVTRPSPRRLVEVRLTRDDTDCVVAECLKAAGHPLPDHVPSVQDFVTADLAEHLLVIDATSLSSEQMAELNLVMAAAAALAHNAPAGSMPVQVVTVASGRHARDAAEIPGLTVLHWWGRLSRLDTALLLRTANSPRRSDATRQTAILEVARFDLTLALHLLDAWDGCPQSLCGVLLDYSGSKPELLAAAPAVRTAPDDRPGTELMEAWASGACDRWDGEGVTWHASAVAKHDPDQLQRALWRAQAATLLPLLDQQRERVLAWLDRQGHAQRLRQEARGDLIEIADLWYYMRKRAGMDKRPQMALVTWLRDARNDVAHLKCLDEERLQTGLTLIAETPL